MNPSPEAYALVREYEKLRLVAYLPTPHDVPTIGYGHTLGVQLGDKCTEADAELWLHLDGTKCVRAINTHVAVPLRQCQFDALFSFIFNLGVTAFKESTLLKKLNARNYAAAAEQFDRWIYQGREQLGGLISRRKRERALFSRDGL